MITSDVKKTNNVDNNNEEVYDDESETESETEDEDEIEDEDETEDEIETKYKNLHYLNADSPCPTGCVEPDKIYGNCHSNFYDDSDDNCYTKCPYKCSNHETTNDYSICHTDYDCLNCANPKYSLFKIDCTDDINGYTG